MLNFLNNFEIVRVPKCQVPRGPWVSKSGLECCLMLDVVGKNLIEHLTEREREREREKERETCPWFVSCSLTLCQRLATLCATCAMARSAAKRMQKVKPHESIL